MAVVINSNVSSLIAQRGLTNNTNNLTKIFQRLSTGSKINSAQDDAAGLSISEKLKFQLNGYQKSINNVKDGISALHIADSGFETMLNNLQRIRELSVQAANGIYSSTERNYILDEIQERLVDFNRVVKTTTFDKTPLLYDSSTNQPLASLIIQTGPNSGITSNTIDIAAAFKNRDAAGNPVALTVTGLGLSSVLVMTTYGGTVTPAVEAHISGGAWGPTQVRNYMSSIDSALDKLLCARSKIGGMLNRMDAVLSSLSSMKENLTSSNSLIRDTDIAQDTAEMTRLQILQQSSTQVLQQVNQLPAIALKLLGG